MIFQLVFFVAIVLAIVWIPAAPFTRWDSAGWCDDCNKPVDHKGFGIVGSGYITSVCPRCGTNAPGPAFNRWPTKVVRRRWCRWEVMR
jgi:hypothetical protein